jgi:hypothetical protein
MPKLTLRDLFAVVTIVALALGWWLDRSRLARSLDFHQARTERLEQELAGAKWERDFVVEGTPLFIDDQRLKDGYYSQ